MLSSLFTRRPDVVQDPALVWTPPGTTVVQLPQHFCLPLRTQGRCDPCDKGYEPSPDTYFASTAPVTHRPAA